MPPRYCAPCKEAATKDRRYGITKRYRQRHPDVVKRWAKEHYDRVTADPVRLAKRRALVNARRARNPIAFQRNGRKMRHGIEPHEFDALMAAQHGLCALCDRELPQDPHEQRTRREPQVDHDHETGVIRGLLCRTCNTRLGVIEKVTPEWSRRVEIYRHSVQSFSVLAAKRMQEALSS